MENKTSFLQELSNEYANSFLTALAIIGALTLALFEYFGLVSDVMSNPYKIGLGAGVTIICIAYFVASRGSWKSLLLVPFFGLYIIAGAFSGRAGIAVQQEKQAQQIEQSNANKAALISKVNEAIDLTITHATIKNNNDLYATARELVATPTTTVLTTDERRAPAVAVLSELGLTLTPNAFETLLSALFTMSLFVAVGVLGKAGNARRISRGQQEHQGDQKVTNPDIDQQDKKLTYTDEELERAIDWDIELHDRKSYSIKLAHKAIKTFYRSDVSAGNTRVNAIVQRKKTELLSKKGDAKSNLWTVIKGGKK